MNITITNRTHSVRLDYNDLAGQPQMGFSKIRSIMKASVLSLKLSVEEDYVEVIYIDGSKEQFVYEIFEGYASNAALYEALDAMIA